MGYGSSYLTTGFTASGVPVESPQRQLSVYATDPVPGRWTLDLDFASPVAGDELADPFTGRIRFNDVGFDRGGLPSSPAVTLASGQAGHLPGLGAQRRCGARGHLPRPPARPVRHLPAAAAEPASPCSCRSRRRPARRSGSCRRMTRSLSVTATSASPAVPVMFDSGPYPGDPDTASWHGQPGKRRVPGRPPPRRSPPGSGIAVPAEIGPYPRGQRARRDRHRWPCPR